jgi:hypothetical protein
MQTIATFGDGIGAHLARGRLQEAGIPVFLVNENTVWAAPHLINAIGGIKLQVADENVDKARTLLAEENAIVSDFEETDETDDNEIAPTRREQNADRAFRGSLIGLLVLPLQFYVSWLLVQVLFSNERIDPRQARRAVIAAIVNLFSFALMIGYFSRW